MFLLMFYLHKGNFFAPIVLPKARSVGLMQKSAPFWENPVIQFGDSDALLGSMLKAFQVSTSVKWIIPVSQQMNFLHFCFQFMQGSKQEAREDNHRQQRSLGREIICIGLGVGNLAGEVVLRWRRLAGGTGEEPRATPPARGKAQLPFEKGFVSVPILALAVSCHVGLAAGKYSAPFCASGGSFALQVYMALLSKRNLFQKWTRRQISKGEADIFP